MSRPRATLTYRRVARWKSRRPASPAKSDLFVDRCGPKLKLLATRAGIATVTLEHATRLIDHALDLAIAEGRVQ